eukprot:Tbor_TRINITY_DN5943_c0_g1::TRINITY_DN5943_c0_g1_i1::g.19190::m.19190
MRQLETYRTYSDSVKDLQKHQKFHHPDKKPFARVFKCEYCDKKCPSTKARSQHYKGCKEMKRIAAEEPKTTEKPDSENLGPEESILHMLECDALQDTRAKHNVSAYLSKYGTRYWYILKFIRWVHNLFGGDLATTEDDENELEWSDGQQKDDETKGDEEEEEESEELGWYSDDGGDDLEGMSRS